MTSRQAEHFVTHFTYSYLPQALALYFSLKRTHEKAILWLVCLDQYSFHALNTFNLSNVHLINFEDYLDDELLQIRKERSLGEFCWTVTPIVPKIILDIDSSIDRITYIDADLWFMRASDAIYQEFDNNKSVLITSHSYAKKYDQSSLSGKYCVQFIIFTRDAENIRSLWEKECREWCYARPEGGKFGDQKYLDKWPLIFPNQVHVLRNTNWALAPWNAVEKSASLGIFYHFHSFKIINKFLAWIGKYDIPSQYLSEIYKSYAKDINKALSIMCKHEFPLEKSFTINASFVYRYFKSLINTSGKRWKQFIKLT